MHRVDTSDNVPALPTSEAAGTAGFFSKGNTGINDSTVPGQDWFNMIQEELVNVVVQAGITLNVAKNDFTQLYDAIVLLINTNIPSATETVSGKAELATQAETDAGVDDVRIVTPLKLKLGFSVSLATNGYIVFPSWLNGFIIQWGVVTSGTYYPEGGINITLPLTYPTAPFAVSVAPRNSSELVLGGSHVEVVSVTTTTLRVFVQVDSNGNTTNGVHWISTGH